MMISGPNSKREKRALFCDAESSLERGQRQDMLETHMSVVCESGT